MSQSIEDIQNEVRRASTDKAALAIKGRGTWTAAYKHRSATRDLSLWNFAGVQEYVPGNLTMTVRAGTTVREIQEIAGAENQWLPLDPFGDKDGTIGATVATGSYGPLITGFGTPRDLVLGVEAVLGTGEVVRGGGRVVKNVAGYDLSRLFTGSWGTLGVISEMTLRLFARQEADTSIGLAIPGKPQAVTELLSGIRKAPIWPWAFERIDSRAAALLGIESGEFLAFRFGGNENVVGAQLDIMRSFGNVVDLPSGFWNTMTGMPHAWSLRFSGLPSRHADTWLAVERLIADVGSGFRTASPDRGIVRAFFPNETDSATLFTAVGKFATSGHANGIQVIIEAMPSASPLTVIGDDRASLHSLSAGVKRAFDPVNILNPGFLTQ